MTSILGNIDHFVIPKCIRLYQPMMDACQNVIRKHIVHVRTFTLEQLVRNYLCEND